MQSQSPKSAPLALRSRPLASSKSRATLGISVETCSVSAGPSSPTNNSFDDTVTGDIKHILRPPVTQGTTPALLDVASQINNEPVLPAIPQHRDVKGSGIPSGAVASLQNSVTTESTFSETSVERLQSAFQPKVFRSIPSLNLNKPRRHLTPQEYAINISTPGAHAHDDHFPEDCFFSTVILIKWSNVVGPKLLKSWTPRFSKADESMLKNVAKQILNGEVGRNLTRTEPKFLVLGDEGMTAASFLFAEYPSPSGNSSTSSSLSVPNSMPSSVLSKTSSYRFSPNDSLHEVSDLYAFAFLVPVQYMQSFSTYFEIMLDRVPMLVEKLLRLKRCGVLAWKDALNYFTTFYLIPFIESIMELEAVSLPIETIKVSHTILAPEGEGMFNKDFIAKVITSHLQTHGNTVVIGPNIMTINMLINTLALFLSPMERNRSCHARKNHSYMPDLFLQGIVGQSGEYDSNIDTLILESPYPTTLVDLNGPTIKQTDLLPNYEKVRADFYRFMVARVDDTNVAEEGDDDSWGDISGSTRPIFHTVKQPAPMIQKILNEIWKLPSALREAYVRQWRRYLVRMAVAMIKYFEDDAGHEQIFQARTALQSPTRNNFNLMEAVTGSNSLSSNLQAMQALSPAFADIRDERDFSIVLAQAEKLKPGMTEYVHVYLGIG